MRIKAPGEIGMNSDKILSRHPAFENPVFGSVTRLLVELKEEAASTARSCTVRDPFLS